MSDRSERLRRLAITRCAECMALLDRPISEDEQRAAAERLGITDWLPEPQQEINFNAPQGFAA